MFSSAIGGEIMQRRETHSEGLRSYVHVEAYPRFDVQEARRALQAGTPSIVWQDRQVNNIGLGIPTWENRDRLSLEYIFEDTANIDACRGMEVFEVVYDGPFERLHKPYLICSRCRRKVQFVCYKDDVWLCRYCHRLKNRSALIGTKARRSEKAAKLEKELVDPETRLIGRPSGMHQRSYEQKRARLSKLNRQLNHERVEGNVDYAFIISARWVKASASQLDSAGAEWDKRHAPAAPLSRPLIAPSLLTEDDQGSD
jgi:hypothetical protein